MAAIAGRDDEMGVMTEINTTPLIDIMLVLLIMFLVTIPIQTHSVEVDRPGGPPPPGAIDRVKNKVVISKSGVILWNGVPVSEAQLGDALDATKRLSPTPELHLQPDPDARYEVVDEVLAITKRARIDAMGFVGNEAYARF